jgi:hypothetical protein
MNIALYCSSKDRLPESWQQAATALGHWLGRRRATLVYGGVDRGLMRIAAAAARGAGASVTGVVPARRRHLTSPANEVTVPVRDLSERKAVIQMLADAFVVLPGGYGTLDELASAFAHLNFTGAEKPVFILNPDGLYDPLLDQIRLMASRGLMDPSLASKLRPVADTDSLIAALERFARTFDGADR